jgi:hypothetical protein
MKPESLPEIIKGYEMKMLILSTRFLPNVSVITFDSAKLSSMIEAFLFCKKPASLLSLLILKPESANSR